MRTRLLTASALAAPAIIHMSAYANGLTGLIPSLYAGLDIVSRELVGMIPSVTRDARADRVAMGQSLVIPITPAANVSDIAPAMVPPEPTDQNIENVAITITKSRAANFGWVGEEQRGLNNNGPGYSTIQADQFAQGLRALTNEIERDLVVEGALRASRAYGTAGTTPFATNVGESAQMKKILDDNGAPSSDRSLVIDTTAGAALRTLQNLTRVNEAGTTMTLRDGELLNLNGFSIKESAGVQERAGATATATTTAGALAKGATVIPIAAGGTGNITAGSFFTMAGDPNIYMALNTVNPVAGGNLQIALPGLRVATTAATVLTVEADGATPNLAFTRNAIVLACRAPALPEEGDAAIDAHMLIDPRSGLAFEVRLYAGYRKIRAEVGAAWGVRGIKPEHVGILLG